MPRGDGTGPQGQGPMTGRAAGFCAGYDAPGFANTGWGRGGRGRGGRGGFGNRNRYRATGMTGRQRGDMGSPMGFQAEPFAAPTREQDIEAMKRQMEYLEGAAGDLRKRIEELEGEKS